MNVIEKSSNGISQISADAKLMSNRKVFIEGEINPETACEFVKKIMILNMQDPNRPIDLLINTPGGCINSGMVYYDVIQASKAPIRTFCIGRAYSMGAILLASGNQGRYILEHGEIMIHQPLLGNRVGGNSSSIKSISESLLETERKMNQILAKHTGKTEEDIEKAIMYDHYFDSKESLAFGLVDEIVDFGKLLEEC